MSIFSFNFDIIMIDLSLVLVDGYFLIQHFFPQIFVSSQERVFTFVEHS